MSWFEIESNNYDHNDIHNYKNTNFYENYLVNYKWESLNLCYSDKITQKKASLKIYFKKILFIHFINAPGGINKKYSDHFYDELINYLNQRFKGIFVFLLNNNEIKNISNKKFKKIKFSSIDTLIKTLPYEEKYLLSDYSSNWRHNYNRSIKKDLIVKINNFPNKQETLELLNRFNKIKKKILYPNLINDLFFYLKYFKSHIYHYECRFNNKLISIRTIIAINNKAWDLFAISDEIARLRYANYNLLHFIFLNLIKKKIKFFDFSGVDIKNNKGVYNFKNGTGCSLLNTNNEFIYANKFYMKYIFILYLYFKRKKYV